MYNKNIVFCKGWGFSFEINKSNFQNLTVVLESTTQQFYLLVMRLEFFRDNAVLTKTKTHFPELTTRWRVRFSFSPFPTRCLASSTCSYGRATPGSSTRRPAGTPRSSPLSQDPGDSRSLRPSKHRQHQAMPTDARGHADTHKRREEKGREEKRSAFFWGGRGMCARLIATLVGTLRIQNQA